MLCSKCKAKLPNLKEKYWRRSPSGRYFYQDAKYGYAYIDGPGYWHRGLSDKDGWLCTIYGKDSSVHPTLKAAKAWAVHLINYAKTKRMIKK